MFFKAKWGINFMYFSTHYTNFIFSHVLLIKFYATLIYTIQKLPKICVQFLIYIFSEQKDVTDKHSRDKVL